MSIEMHSKGKVDSVFNRLPEKYHKHFVVGTLYEDIIEKVLLDQEKEIQKLKSELKREREAVDFYANEENWVQESNGNWYGAIIYEDINSVRNKDRGDEWGDPFIDTGGKSARNAQRKRKIKL